jgi:hypothetical protein
VVEGQVRAYMLAQEEGVATWFAGALMVLKAAGEQTTGQSALLDQRAPGDYAVPRHVHDRFWGSSPPAMG